MQCFMLWDGGSGYSHAEIPRDLEEFDSLRAAKDAFWRRLDDHYYPCVSEAPPSDGGPEARIFFYDPREVAEPYPDRLMSFGPRGGVRVETMLTAETDVSYELCFDPSDQNRSEPVFCGDREEAERFAFDLASSCAASGHGTRTTTRPLSCGSGAYGGPNTADQFAGQA